MIRYSLVCDKGHDFESWFADSAAYDKQAKRGLVACPHCGSTKVDKAIMAPRLAGARKRTQAAEMPPAAAPEKTQEKAQEKASVAMISPQEQELRAGMMVVVPQGLWHRFESPGGVTLMSVTPLPTDHPEVDVEDPR